MRINYMQFRDKNNILAKKILYFARSAIDKGYLGKCKN